MFRNTLRFNLDPLEKCSDERIWSALESAQMKEIVNEFPEGLDFFLEGSEFSAGEKQLLCLARAIIANKKIVVMDEATANVDLITSQKMQEAVKHSFQNNTMCTIAHRLHTVIEYDKIVVLDNGTVKEADHPHLLLEKKNSAFSKLVTELGEDSEEILREAAAKSYELKYKTE